MNRGRSDGFRRRYGEWALVAGASEGLGEAFARALAERGVDLLLVARRAGPLRALGEGLAAEHRVRVRTLALDLAEADAPGRVLEAAAGLEVGLLVCNAAHAPIGRFLDLPVEEHLRVVAVNCRAPLLLAHGLAPSMVGRGRGGIVLMASMAGLQGSAMVASYAASKAFDLILAESLWAELSEAGVDLLACVAGPTDTPAYRRSRPRSAAGDPLLLSPDVVAQAALRSLGGRPTLIPGVGNRASAFLLQRLLPRAAAARLVSSTTRRMYAGRRTGG